MTQRILMIRGERIKTSGQVKNLNHFLNFNLKNYLKKDKRAQIKTLNNKRKN